MEKPIDLKTKEIETKKVKRLFGHCFEMSKIDDGDLLGVGGDLFEQNITLGVKVDYQKFDEFFQSIKKIKEQCELPKLKNWLTSQKFDFDENLFAELYAFTIGYEKKYPEKDNQSEYRGVFYEKASTQPKLSDVFEAKFVACAEIAALAQGYLQKVGINSSYFSGEVLWDIKHEYSEEHSFLIIRHNGKVYVYDATNPISSTAGKMPSIYEIKGDFDGEMAKNQKRFVKAINILSKSESFFGVNNGTNIVPERHIAK